MTTTPLSPAELREMLEKATPIPMAPGYAATEDGRILSTESNWRGYGVRELVQHPGKGGYLRVRMMVNGRRVGRPVHRLIADAFLQPRPGLEFEVRHKDGTRTNNCRTNLAWGTRKENAADRTAHGRTAAGERNGWSKLTDEQRQRAAIEPVPAPRLAKEFGVTKEAINRIRRLHRERHAHG